MNTTENKPASTIFNIKDFTDVFKRNHAEAQRQYTGKTIMVSGVVRTAGPDSYGLPSVELTDKEDGQCYALCLLPFSDYLKLRNVKKGQEVVVTGECRYLSDASSYKDVLVMKHCKVSSE